MFLPRVLDRPCQPVILPGRLFERMAPKIAIHDQADVGFCFRDVGDRLGDDGLEPPDVVG